MPTPQQPQTPGATPQTGQPPRGAPMSGPSNAMGNKLQAQTRVHVALNMLELALPDLGSETKEGTAVRKAMEMIVRHFPGSQPAAGLVPAEIQQLNRDHPGGQMVNPMQRAAMSGPPSPQAPPGLMPAMGMKPPGMPGMPQPGM